MNKCHVPITWVNDQTPAINDTHLNQYDGELDTLDDRIITLDTTKALQSDMLLAFKDVSLNSTTGVITFTLFNNTTKTIDTLLEKITINFDYDDDPTSPHYQNLIIELEDGTYKYIDMSALITEYEFTDSSTIDFTVTSGAVSASVIDGSITATKCDPTFALAITDAEANGLKSEGFANGTQNGTPVTSGSPYYENNAKYWKEQAQAIASQTLSGLTDVSIFSPTDGQVLAYDDGKNEWTNSTLIRTIASLDDTSINTPRDGETLVYDAANYVWINGKGGILPHVIVISETGSTVTLTKGLKVISATETSTGHFEADVDEYGTWTVDSVLGADDAQTTLNVDAVKVYTITDEHVSATITVSYPSGGTCTLSATGQTPQAASSSPYTFTVHELATYTISAVYRGVTRTTTITISSTGQTETYSFLVDGSTATANSGPTWLDCACLWDKSYTTMAAILADMTTLSTLIGDSNAVAYLVRSTTWTSDICSDQNAMTYIGLDNDCSDALLGDTTWRAAICASTYFESVLNVKVPTMTSNTTPSGEAFGVEYPGVTPEPYKAFDGNISTAARVTSATGPVDQSFGYKFTASKHIYLIRGDVNLLTSASHYATFKFQYSSDGIGWVDVPNSTFTTETVSHENRLPFNDIVCSVQGVYFRMYCIAVSPAARFASFELQFYGRQGV